MKTDLHLVFSGKCREAFAFYEKTFNTKVQFTMTFGEAPEGSPVPPDSKDLILHTSMPVGSITLMGCDAPKGREATLGGFQISVSDPSTDEVERIFDALKEGGSVQMPIGPTFWSPLFGMCTDKFGVGWMVSVPGPQM
ncbi:VOC family protein [Granulicella sp. L46]|jgi:PhnB protein|uniref:VOC family protein n=1 Tax=Granulicella sp. L46 TaxID=1641865 RepID=UPI00131CF029|nr:VOC family protein [Granulicella sp. L46]